jgi:crossover junction endodeoxyribonuclease RusA
MGKRAATILSEQARAYRKAVCAAVLVQRIARGKLTGKLSVSITVCPPDRRARDLDNLPKGILDSLKHAAVIADDSEIDELLIRRVAIVKEGQIRIVLREIAGEPTVSGQLDLQTRVA